MNEQQEQAIIRLYCKLKNDLHLFASRFCPNEAEDIVHQAFVNCLDQIEVYHSESSQRSYLFTTVRNLCLNFIRNKRPLFPDKLPEIYKEFITIDAHDYLYELIEYLPSIEKQILIFSLRGYKVEEIAKLMNMEYNTVRYYKKIAYARIREIVHKN